MPRHFTPKPVFSYFRYAMLPLLFWWVGLPPALQAQAQTPPPFSLPVSSLNALDITQCSGTLTDDGGPDQTYSAVADGYITLRPENPCQKMRVSFDAIRVDPCCASVRVFDGPDLNAPAFHPPGGWTSGSYDLVSTHPSGALTIQLVSSGVPAPGFSGFTASFNCTPELPETPQVEDLSLCGAGTAVLNVTAGGNLTGVELYDQPTGGSALGFDSSPPYALATPFLSTDATYYVAAFNSNTTCSSSRVPVQVRVLTQAPDPGVVSLERCGSGPITLSANLPASPAYQVRYYDTPTGGAPIGVSTVQPFEFTTEITSATTFYAEALLASGPSCVSNRVPISANVLTPPAAPMASDVQRCGSGPLSIEAMLGGGAGSEMRLYDDPQSGVPVSVANSAPYLLTVPSATSTQTYFLETFDLATGCSSTLTPVVGAVDAVPDNPTVNSPVTQCGEGPLTIEPALANAEAGKVLRLWDQPLGGAVLQVDDTPPFAFSWPDVTAPQTYYIDAFVPATQCSSAVRQQVQINLQAASEAAFSPETVCLDVDSTIEVRFTGSQQPGALFNWDCGGCSVLNPLGGENYEVAWDTPGIKTVRLEMEDVNGCISSFETLMFVGEDQGLEDQAVQTNAPICAGEDLTLTAPPIAGANYRWRGPDSFGSSQREVTLPSVTGSNSGSYALEITANGCNLLAVTADVVIQTPPVIEVPRPNVVCADTSLELLATDVPGARYAWQGPGNIAGTSPDLFIPQIRPQNAGTYTLTVIAQACTVEKRIPVEVRENISIPPFSLDGPLCAGETLTLDAPFTADATYRWEYRNNLVGNQRRLSISNLTPAEAGFYRLTVQVPGCPEVVTETEVQVNEIPDIVADNNSPVCAGNNIVQLTATFVPGATYTWIGPGNFNESVRNPIIQNAGDDQTGTYLVQVDLEGCPSAYATTEVEIDERPTPTIQGDSPICAGETLVLTTQFVPGATYRWEGPGNLLRETRSPQLRVDNISADRTGTYVLTVLTRGCPPATANRFVEIHELPDQVFASSNSPLCNTSVLTLDATEVAGGSYQWRGPASFSSTRRNPRLTGISPSNAGRYSVSVSVPGCNEIRTDAVDVVIQDFEPRLESNGPVCEGQTLRLTASSGVIDAEYLWDGPAGFSTQEQSPAITGTTTANTGTYTLTISAPGCGSLVRTLPASVRARPDFQVTSNGPVCLNDRAELSIAGYAPPQGVDRTIVWTGPQDFRVEDTPTASFQPTSLNQNGIYTVAYTLEGCPVVRQSVQLTLKALPATFTIDGRTTYCAGEQLSLAVEPLAAGTIYRWTGPNLAPETPLQDLVIPAAGSDAAGLYTVQAVRDGCTRTLTFEVGVLDNPDTPDLVIDSPVCAGNPATLNSDVISGSLIWSGPNGFRRQAAAPLTIPAVDAARAGTYSLIAVAGGCTSEVAEANLVVTQPPSEVVVDAPDVVCRGAQLTLEANQVPNAAYLWEGPGDLLAETRKVTLDDVQPRQDGVYTLSVVVPGCDTVRASTSVTVNAPPDQVAASNNGPICEGETLELEAIFVAGAQYRWLGPGYEFRGRTARRRDLTPAQSGLYTAEIAVPGCPPVLAESEVVVNPVPDQPVLRSNAPVCAGGNLELEVVAPRANTTYLWTGPGGFNAETTRGVLEEVEPNQTGSYDAVAIAEGCTSARSFINVEVVPVPLEPQFNINSPYCVGDNVSLITNVRPNLDYRWAGPSGWSSNSPTPVIESVTADQNGVYSLTVSSEGCESNTITRELVVNEPIRRSISMGSNSPICEGEDLTFTVTEIPEAEYTWYLPFGGGPLVGRSLAFPSDAFTNGVYTVQVTVPGCPPVEQTTEVEVNRLPEVINAGNTGPVCQGASLLLTADPIRNADYLWTGPNGFFTSQPTPLLDDVQVTASGIYNVIVSVPGCNGRLLASTQVTVNRQPNPVASNSGPVCVGDDLSLFVGAWPNATYAWRGPDNFSFSDRAGSIPDVQSLNAGNYLVEVSVPGCSTVTASTDVLVYEQPERVRITRTNPVCEGQDLNMTAETIPDAQYRWRGPRGFTATGPDVILNRVTPRASGTYSVAVTVPGCDPVVGTTSPRVQPAPAMPVIQATNNVCTGSLLEMGTVPAGGASYRWEGPNNWTAIGPMVEIPDLDPGYSGVYSLVAIVDGCTSQVATRGIEVQPAPPLPTVTNNGPICPGTTLQLGAQTLPRARYLWTGPNGFRSAAQNAFIPEAGFDVAGTYSLVAFLGDCPSPTATTEVLVQTAEDLSSVRSNSPLCVGDSLSFTAVINPEATYRWQGPAGFTNDAPTGTIPEVGLNNAGLYTLTAVLGSCTTRKVLQVEISPQPSRPVITAPETVCGNAPLQLTAAAQPGVSYRWSGPGAFQSQEVAPELNRPLAGVYELQVVQGGCASLPDRQRINVGRPTVSLTSDVTALCPDESARLFFQAAGTGPWRVAYEINGQPQEAVIIDEGATPGSGQAELEVIPGENATYRIRSVTDALGCEIETDQAVEIRQTVSYDSIEVSNDGPACVGRSVRLEAPTIQGAVYRWTGPDGFSVSAQSPLITNINTARTGVYSLEITAGRCTSAIYTTEVKLTEGPTATLSGSPNSTCIRTPVDLDVRFTGLPPWTITYQVNSNAPITVRDIQDTLHILPVTPTASGINTVRLISVTDASNCSNGSVSGLVSVRATTPPILNIESTTSASCGAANGSLVVSATGGTGDDYLYSIERLNLSNDDGIFTNLPAGTYLITADDGNCQRQETTVVGGELMTSITGTTPEVTAIEVDWLPLTGVGFYNIRYRPAGSQQNFVIINNVTGNARRINGLQPDTEYEISVQPVCANGEGADWSPSVVARTLRVPGDEEAGCPAPEVLTVVGLTSNSVSMVWSNVPRSTCYILAYGPAAEAPDTWRSLLVPHPGTSLFVRNLDPGTSYGFRVRVNCSECSSGSGERSSWSPVQSFTTRPFRTGAVSGAGLRDVEVYPNPNTGQFTVKLHSTWSGQAQWRLLDASGLQVEAGSRDLISGTPALDFDLQTLPAGLYLLELRTPEGLYRTRVLVR